MDAASPASAGIGRTGLLPVHLAAWGFNRADVEHAIDAAKAGVARSRWAFSEERTVRIQCAVCPLDLTDGAALAAEQGPYWAYLVTLADKSAQTREASR